MVKNCSPVFAEQTRVSLLERAGRVIMLIGRLNISLKSKFRLLSGLSLLLVGLLSACGDAATATPGSISPTAPVATSAATASVTAQPTGGTVPTAVGPTSPTNTTVPSTTATVGAGGLTMKKAFAQLEPQVKTWQADAVYISISNPPDSPIGIDPEGRSQGWFFETLSPSTTKHAFWLVSSDATGKATVAKSIEDSLPKDRTVLLGGRKLPEIGSLIDTDQLMQVARQNGGTASDRPVGTRLARSAKEGEPLAFDLLFYKGEDVVRLRIDAQSGKPVENEKG